VGDTEQFLVPGRHAFTVETPGEYRVWNDYRTVFQGRTYDGPRELPDGARITVTEAAGGRALAVTSGGSATSSMPDAERVAIASFEPAAPGRYEIVVEGDFKPRVFSVAPDFFPRLFFSIIAAVCAVLFGITAALCLAFWTFFRRHPDLLKAKTAGGAPVAVRPAATATSAPVAKTPEQSAKELATVVYASQAASFFLVFTLVAGVIVNYVTREQAAGTWVESHYRWQIRTFWWWLVWALVGLVLVFVLVGFAVWLVDAIWLIYRIVKGWVRLSEGKPMYENA